MNHHSNLYAPDFGFDSSNSSSTLTLKFDECEAITESSGLDAFHTNTNSSSADNSASVAAAGMMSHLKDNPVLTTASMPIPARSLGGSSGQNVYRMPLDLGLDFDLSQDLSMPQLLLMDGAELNDDSSPTMPSLGGQAGYGTVPAANDGAAFSPLAEQGRTGIGMAAPRTIDVLGPPTGLHQHQAQQLLPQHHQHLLATSAAGQQMWGSEPLTTTAAGGGHSFVQTKAEPLNLDDDDAIFQVDKADLIQGGNHSAPSAN